MNLLIGLTFFKNNLKLKKKKIYNHYKKLIDQNRYIMSYDFIDSPIHTMYFMNLGKYIID